MILRESGMMPICSDHVYREIYHGICGGICRKFAKSLAWVHGPFVAHDRFVVQYDMDVTDTGSKKRMQLSEIGVYAVKDGKIVREEFLPSTGQS